MYYFATIDDLLVATLTMVNDSYLSRFDALPDDDAGALEMLAELIANSTSRNRPYAIAEYELCLMAARRPALRGELDRWAQALDRFAARFVGDPIDRSGLTAAIDGLFLRAFSVEVPPGAAEVAEILERLLRRRCATPP